MSRAAGMTGNRRAGNKAPMLDNTALKNNGKHPEKVLTATEATC